MFYSIHLRSIELLKYDFLLVNVWFFKRECFYSNLSMIQSTGCQEKKPNFVILIIMAERLRENSLVQDVVGLDPSAGWTFLSLNCCKNCLLKLPKTLLKNGPFPATFFFIFVFSLQISTTYIKPWIAQSHFNTHFTFGGERCWQMFAKPKLNQDWRLWRIFEQ